MKWIFTIFVMIFSQGCTRAVSPQNAVRSFLLANRSALDETDRIYYVRPHGKPSPYVLITTSSRMGKAGGDWELWDARQKTKLGTYELPNLQMIQMNSDSSGVVRVTAYWAFVGEAAGASATVTRSIYEVTPTGLKSLGSSDILAIEPEFEHREAPLSDSCALKDCDAHLK